MKKVDKKMEQYVIRQVLDISHEFVNMSESEQEKYVKEKMKEFLAKRE